jgi:ribosomal protein L22
MKYALNPKPKKSSRVYGRNLRVSTKNSVAVCRAVSGMTLKKAESLLEGMVSGKRDLNGKHYTKTAEEILGLLRSARNNADFQGLEPDNMVVRVSAHKGFKLWTPRRFKLRRTTGKNTNIQVVLEK